MLSLYLLFFFFFNDTATTEIYTLSLHDALPISSRTTSVMRSSLSSRSKRSDCARRGDRIMRFMIVVKADRKSTRLNSSHLVISYAVFCLKKKKNYKRTLPVRHIRCNPQNWITHS